MSVINVAVLGAAGRMGRALSETIVNDPRFSIAAAVVEADDEQVGQVVAVGSSVSFTAELPDCDVVVDFTTPDGLLQRLPEVVARGAALVTGTTGLTAVQSAQLDAAAAQIPVLAAANMSLGVQLTHQLVALAASRLGVDVDVEVVDVHHRHKKDAPSGTALALGRTVAAAREQRFDAIAQLSRQGTDSARREGEIGFSAARLGDVVGDHTVIFGLDGERVEVTHRANSRQAFVRGALAAAEFLHGKPAGRYRLDDVLKI